MRNGKLNLEQRQKLTHDYINSKNTLRYYSNIYNISPEAISYILKKNGCCIRQNKDNRRKFSFDYNYFDSIDCESKAYFLGLLYADGSNSKRGYVKIALQEKDCDILRSFSKEIKFTGELKKIEYNDKNINHQNQYELRLVKRHFSDNLIKLGCYPKKSLILDFPNESQVPDNLIYHFIRGYFDGDGSVGIYSPKKYPQRKNVYLRITSTLNFCEKLKQIIDDKGIASCIVNHKCNDITKTLTIGGIKSSKIFINWLYNDANFYIERKKEKCMQILSM